MWGRALPLLLLLPGAVGLECLSCGAEAGPCRGAANVSCPPDSDVCTEAWAGLAWSHGQLALGARGCGRGRAGAIARALQPLGLQLFARRRHCSQPGCNQRLPLGTPGALPLPGNETGRAPNGLLCYGCPEGAGPCPSPTVVRCYGDLRGCFRGNLSLTLGGVSQWREVRGCVTEPGCPQGAWGDAAVGLRGSCCAGDLCNGPPANQSLFAPHLPRLQLLPHGHAPTAAPDLRRTAAATPKMAATGAAAGKRVDGGGGDDVIDDVIGHLANGNLSAGDPNMAAVDPNMAAVDHNMAAGDPNMAASDPNMAATDPNMAATDPNMAAGDPNMAAADPNMATIDPNMAASDPNMAATDPKMATTDPNMAAVDPNMAASDPNMAATDPKMAATDPNMAAVDPNMAASDPNMAAGDPNMAATDPNMAAVNPNMAAADPAPRGGRPLEGREGIKAPVGRGHPIAGPGWLLPLLLLPRL